MTAFKEEYPNIENPNGLESEKLISQPTTFVFPVGAADPQQDNHVVTKLFYEQNIPPALATSRDSNGYGTRFISTTTETPAADLGTDGDIYYYCGE